MERSLKTSVKENLRWREGKKQDSYHTAKMCADCVESVSLNLPVISNCKETQALSLHLLILPSLL